MKPDTLQTYRERMLRVLVYIQDHLDDAVSLDELAGISCFSPYHFHRLFRALVGESVQRYVRRLRLERAAGVLKHTRRPIVDVALDAGYESHEAFTRAFQALFGVSPSAFRARRASRPVAVGLRGVLGGERVEGPEITVKTLPSRRIAFVRHVGPYGDARGAFERLLAWAAPKGLLASTTILGISYDDPSITPEDKIRYDAALTVDEDIAGGGEVGIREMPGGEHAVLCHQGPYGELARTYDFIYGQWLPVSGREPANAPPFEVYVNDPESTEPEELLTDVHVPLKEDV